ncbi:MAG: hypothetical protein SD837_20645 [Candidatus Electrothrix scaldis]|nr:MAG: hypothetical protein SD837_20645 [Candidatus Electrothrix sp. GW3-3]
MRFIIIILYQDPPDFSIKSIHELVSGGDSCLPESRTQSAGRFRQGVREGRKLLPLGIILRHEGIAFLLLGIIVRHKGIVLRPLGIIVRHEGIAFRSLGIIVRHKGIALRPL